MLYYSNNTWLNELSYNPRIIKFPYKIFKDNRYFQLYNFHNNIVSVDNSNVSDRKPYFPSKKTSKLFEYYAVILAIEILRNNGLNWVSGWIADTKNEELFNGEIPTNEPMIFEKDNLKCELFYEKIVRQDIEIVSSNTSDFVRINARHYEPDIIIALFDKEKHTLLKSVVIEVKCVISRNLYSNNGPTKAIEQAKDYYNFGYYDKNIRAKNKTRRGVVEEIIIIYPKQNKKITYDYGDINLSFIQVEANESKDITNHYGYDELKDAIEGSLGLNEYF